MAGIMCHTGHMNVGMAVFVAGIGGFVGDQIYFYIGRYSKRYIHRKLSKHRRKFAIAHLLLQKYGWPLIFVQRYMYGLRTVIPMSIGLTRYSARKFAFINLLSAWVWATITIILAYIFGEELLEAIKYAKSHWYFALPFAGAMLFGLSRAMKRIEYNIEYKRRGKNENRNK
jgi:membrane protein DedA with SNARE-associated domain